jgi:hypothetical protein
LIYNNKFAQGYKMLREISTEQEKTNAKEIKTRLFLVKRNLTAAQ